MTSAAQMESNRLNAQRSTGPRSEPGKTRSSQNAVKHTFTGRLLVGLQYGPFKDDPEELQAFVNVVVAELGPIGAQEQAEALNIAGLYVRRARLVELEALAVSYGTKAQMLPPESPGQQERIVESELMRSAAEALSVDLFDRLPRYEAHLSRELDRGLARLGRLQEARLARESTLLGEVVEDVMPAGTWSQQGAA